MAGWPRVIHIASVVQGPVVAKIFVGITMELESVLRIATVDMTQPNLEVTEARRHDGCAAWLSGVVGIDRDVVGGPVTKAG